MPTLQILKLKKEITISSLQKLKKQADVCLAKKADMPMSPLINMANVTVFNNTGDLKSIQDAVDFLTCKAKAKMKFDEDDKEFLKELFEAFWYRAEWIDIWKPNAIQK